MSSLNISCFGILLKHHLLRHHADAVVRKAKLLPELAHALEEIPADFQIEVNGPVPCRSACQTEEHLHLQLRLGKNGEWGGEQCLLYLQGILAWNGHELVPHALLPGALMLTTRDARKPDAAQIQKALSMLARAEFEVVMQNESRIGVFRPAPSALVLTRTARSTVPVARVA